MREGTSSGFDKKNIEGRKNKVTRNLTSSIIKKCNGYEIIKHELARTEKMEFTPINIIMNRFMMETWEFRVTLQMKFILPIEVI